MSHTMQDDPPLPIEHRIRTAYFEARKRSDAPYDMLDREFNLLQARLGNNQNADYANLPGGASAAMEAARANLLEEAEKLFLHWVNLPQSEMTGAVFRMQHPPAPPMPPQRVARELINHLESRRGIRLELWHKSFRVMPAAKLEPSEKAALTSLKDHVLAELKQRADAWYPE